MTFFCKVRQNWQQQSEPENLQQNHASLVTAKQHERKTHHYAKLALDGALTNDQDFSGALLILDDLSILTLEQIKAVLTPTMPQPVKA